MIMHLEFNLLSCDPITPVQYDISSSFRGSSSHGEGTTVMDPCQKSLWSRNIDRVDDG